MRLRHLERRLTIALSSAIALAGAAACGSDKATGPDVVSSTASLSEKLAASGGTTLRVPTLTHNVALTQDRTITGVIGSEGGYIGSDELGVWLYVPQGAVRSNVTFTITAKAGSAVAYDFGPAGSVFTNYVIVVQDLTKTNWVSLANQLAIEGGYYAADNQLDTKQGDADVSEFVYTQVDLKHSRALVYVNHFSGYVIATGDQTAQ